MLSIGPQLQSRLESGAPSVLLCREAGWVPLEHHVTLEAAQAARDRYARFAPVLGELFAEQGWDGVISSPLREFKGEHPSGARVLVKCDHELPLTGTIKARGGVYEVLCLVEELATKAGLLDDRSDLMALLLPEAKEMLAQTRVLVASTGNLAYSIGLAARAFGMNAEVHMSQDAKEWKKRRLRQMGVDVVEHAGDFGLALHAARDAARSDSRSYLIDDEESPTLKVGYSAGAWELAAQLEGMGVTVDASHPLFVYLPCGVGGAGGGVTFGLKKIFGPHAKCIFVEPIASAAMYLALGERGWETPPSVFDAGLDNRTIADGLAVGKVSELVVKEIGHCIDGVVALPDRHLLHWVEEAWRTQGLRLEPAAAAGLAAIAPYTQALASGIDQHAWHDLFHNGTHVAWTTGGSQLPDAEFSELLAQTTG